jgi:hypothetical protein
MPRIVDPNRFILLGAVTDWLAVYRRYVGRVPTPSAIQRERKLERERIVQLRWITSPALGYPTEPFKVWRRPAQPLGGEKKLAWKSLDLLGMRVLVLERPQVFVRVGIQVNTAGATIMAFSGTPMASAFVGSRTLTAGFQSVVLSGAAVQTLVVPSGAAVQSISGLDAAAAEDPSWQLVELVGLPVGPDWAGVFDLGVKQGLVGAPLPPPDAALDRYRRGAPFYGWEQQITATVAAPPWVLADPKAMLKVMRDGMLDPLKQMVTTLAPHDHATFSVKHSLAPAGGSGGDPAVAQFHPLQTLVFGASTDPLASLVSGFGTAFVDQDLPPIVLGNQTLFGDPDRSDWDYMVTARYAKGADGRSAAAEYAAIVFAPAVASPPPVPANLATANDGLKGPPQADEDWRGVVRVTWDKLADTLPFRVGSYALARARQAPAGPVVPLMDVRPYDVALQPIGATASPQQAKQGRLQALDDRYAIATAPNPNAVLYGVAHQDLFGLWSAWSTAPLGIGEPPVRPVSILSARIDVVPAAGPCPASLVIEFAWDWATRTPERIEFVGRLYAQAKLGDPPANLAVPAGLQTTLPGGAGFVLRIDYDGAATAVPNPGTPALNVQVAYLTQDGKSFTPGPVATPGPRRYRITITNANPASPALLLDFDTAPRIGLALWARAVEHRAPNRSGDWSTRPTVASTADPRPPVLDVQHEDVLLASMPDAAGAHHARLTWPPAPGATGYFVYTTTEEKLRADRDMPTAPRSLTLSQRLALLRSAFAADPGRRSFTRVNAEPVKGTSLEVVIPRGSKEIHLYVIIGVSAGQVESAWPSPGDPLLAKRPIAYAAPQVVVPSPPDLEVARVLDTGVTPPAYRAQLRVRAKPGAPVARVDLHRVRVPEAALALDTMGPPVAQLTGSTAQYEVKPTVSGEPGVAQALGTIIGRDAVEGSWKRVFYRAVAWSGDDPARGLYGGRSPASAVREVVVPPATPPDLSALSWQWPGGSLGDARIDALTLAPVAETPLGPHRVRVDVTAVHPDNSAEALFTYPAAPGGADRLDQVGTAPPGPGAHGLWREAGGAPGQTALRVLARRASIDDRLRVRVLLTDPLGRATERTLEVPAGSPLPAPDVLDVAVSTQVGLGFLVTARTTVPVPATPIGPYQLQVQLAPLGGGPPIQGQKALPTLVVGVSNNLLFSDPATIPMRRAALPNGTQLIAAIRGGGGKVTVTVLAPDGRSASVTRSLT